MNFKGGTLKDQISSFPLVPSLSDDKKPLFLSPSNTIPKSFDGELIGYFMFWTSAQLSVFPLRLATKISRPPIPGWPLEAKYKSPFLWMKGNISSPGVLIPVMFTGSLHSFFFLSYLIIQMSLPPWPPAILDEKNMYSSPSPTAGCPTLAVSGDLIFTNSATSQSLPLSGYVLVLYYF